MLEILSDPATWASLATLTVMEIVLGIDNIIFITILAGKLPPESRDKARLIGLGLACIMRLGLLLAISWLVGLTAPLLEITGFALSGRDLILMLGGLFLIYKATKEIHEKLEGDDHASDTGIPKKVSFAGVLTQIVLLDIVFSLDSVLTAIGMAEHVEVMMAAVIISLGVMMLLGKSIGDFVMRHPTVKMLALSFLLMIGVTLIAEAFHSHIPKGYVYSAMAFSVLVETLNLWAHKRRVAKGQATQEPVALRQNAPLVDVTE
jgi:predicted tellurium resistance membrane protein TerC